MAFNELTPKNFSLIIESIRLKYGLSRFESIVMYMEENEIDVETMSKLVTSDMKQLVEAEQRQLNNLKHQKTGKTAKLGIKGI